MSRPDIRWGIVGPGRIAELFAPELRLVPGHRLLAVGSRSPERARRFAAAHAAPRAYGSYEELCADPEVQVVYVATPHPGHHAATTLALRAGKAVLCEKPFMMNAREAREAVECARARGLFLMEAMWSRFFPAMATLKSWLADGRIGEVRGLIASFGFRAPWKPQDRLLNPELGGGALLDVGVYPLALAFDLLGSPDAIEAAAHVGETRVDEQTALVLRYPQGALAQLSCSIRGRLPDLAVVHGTHGRIEIGPPFWRPHRLVLHQDPDPDAPSAPGADPARLVERLRSLTGRLPRRGLVGSRLLPLLRRAGQRLLRGGPARVVRFPQRGHGFHHEIAEVGRCLAGGLVESPRMPHAESVRIAETLDAVRLRLGLPLAAGD